VGVRHPQRKTRVGGIACGDGSKWKKRRAFGVKKFTETEEKRKKERSIIGAKLGGVPFA